MTTRAFKYRLLLDDHQERRLLDVQARLRMLWNRAVGHLNHALWMIQHGRRSSLIAEFRRLRGDVKPVGARAGQINKLVAAGRTREEAIKLLDEKTVSEAVSIYRAKKTGPRMIWAAARRLAAAYAELWLTQDAPRQWFDGLHADAYSAMSQRFHDCLEAWKKNSKTHGPPKRKKMRNGVALGFKARKFSLQREGDRVFVDLSRIGGSHLSRCRLVLHRELPEQAEVLNVRVAGSRGMWTVSFELRAPDEAFAITGVQTGGQVGIDPGLKAALTIVRGDDTHGKHPETVTPASEMPNANRVLAQQKRLQRHLSRQLKLNNPDCIGKDGAWIKGKRASNISRGMIKTQARLARLSMRVTDFRTQFYHRVANRILAQNDLVAVGSFRPTDMAKKNRTGKAAKKGLGAARRGRNRKSYQHAISTFVAMLKDKARRYNVERKVVDVAEQNTTRTCPNCLEKSGPTSLDIRSWVCDKCGAGHNRDGAAAWNILQKALTT